MTQIPEQSISKPKRFRNTLITGIIFLVPMALTFWVLDLVVRATRRIAGPYVTAVLQSIFHQAPELLINLCSLLMVLILVLLIGWLTNFYLGKKFLGMVDSTMMRLPFVRSIYGGAKQIIEAFDMGKTGESFKKVILMEYPRRGCWALGFVTNEAIEKTRTIFGRQLIGVFMPSTPNPTTGFLLYLDPHDLYVLDIQVEDAVKLIVSGGLVTPETFAKKPPRNFGDLLDLERPARRGGE